MGRDLYENFDSARAVFKEADRVLGFPLSELCFAGPDDELLKTVNVQPAMVTVSFACLEAATRSNGLPPPDFVAGHSLGEYTALAAARVFDLATTVNLARERGCLMHEAGLRQPGGMVAVIGLDEAEVAEVCHETDTRIANVNCPGQLVISGAKESLARAVDLARARGAYRTIPLRVSGAFHTPLMQPAVDGMSQALAGLSFQTPQVTVIANTTAQPVITPGLIKEELLNQLCHCVQWQRSIEYMIAQGVSTFVEIGPGRVLSGLIKRIDRDVKTVNIGDVPAIKDTGLFVG